VENKQKTIIIIVVAVLVIVSGIAFWYWSQKKASESENPTVSGNAIEVKDGLGAEALNKVNNPLANELPETNPFQVNTNPFEAQTNPFNKVYRNPFK